MAGTRLEPSLRKMTRADCSPTPAMRPTSPSPSITAEPSSTPSTRPTLTMAERRNGLPASAITSPVTKVRRGFSRTLLSASSRAFFCSSCSAASRQPCMRCSSRRSSAFCS